MIGRVVDGAMWVLAGACLYHFVVVPIVTLLG